MNRIFSFPPIITERSKILILGSVPGVKSLEQQQYYAHPQNKFWRILYEIFDQEFSSNYGDKIQLLKDHHIALWDIIDSCERSGSLDVKIKNEEQNDISNLLKNYPTIKAIFCNGQKAYKNVKRDASASTDLPIFVLPSTSPAYTVSYNLKLSEWKKILKYLE